MTEPWSCSGRVGLMDRAGHRPAELSGRPEAARCRRTGTGQRPVLILADEPTGNLDSRSGADPGSPADTPSGGRTILIVTHDETVATRAGTSDPSARRRQDLRGGSGLGGSRSALSIYKLLPLSCLSFLSVNSSLMGHVASPHTLWHHS